MKRAFSSLFLVAAAAFAAAGPAKATVHDLLTKPALDKKTVQVAGVVQDFRQKSSYFLFTLADRKDAISVFGRGKCPAALKNGAKALVVGQFARERRAGTRVYKNEIEVEAAKSGPAPVRLVK